MGRRPKLESIGEQEAHGPATPDPEEELEGGEEESPEGEEGEEL